MTGEEKIMQEIFKRLDRMETKIDSEFANLNKAMVNIARIDEKIVSLMEKDARREQMIDDMALKVAQLETALAENKIRLALIFSGVGVICTVVSGIVIAFVKGVVL